MFSQAVFSEGLDFEKIRETHRSIDAKLSGLALASSEEELNVSESDKILECFSDTLEECLKLDASKLKEVRV